MNLTIEPSTEPSDTDDEEEDDLNITVVKNGAARVGGDSDDEDDSDGASSHEEFVPKSCKKSQQHTATNGTKRFMSPRYIPLFFSVLFAYSCNQSFLPCSVWLSKTKASTPVWFCSIPNLFSSATRSRCR